MSIRIVYNDGQSEDGEQQYGNMLYHATFNTPHNIDWGRTSIDGVRLENVPLATAKRGYVFYLLKLESGRAMVAAGCRYMSIPEYRAHVAREYPGTDKATKTLRILDFFEALARDAQCTGLGDEAPAQPNNRQCPDCGGPTHILSNSQTPALCYITCSAKNGCQWGLRGHTVTVAQYDAQYITQLRGLADHKKLPPDPPPAPEANNRRCPRCAGVTAILRPNNPALSLIACNEPGPCDWGITEVVRLADFDAQQHITPANPAPPPPLGPYDTEKARRVREQVSSSILRFISPTLACPRCGNGLWVESNRLACFDSVPSPTCGWGRAPNERGGTGPKTREDAIREWDEKRAAEAQPQQAGLADIVAPPPRTLVEDMMELLNSNPKIERISNRLDNMQRLIEGLCDHLGVR